MRALAGPAMLLVMVGGFAIYRGMAKEEAPSHDFLELEFAGADADRTGSCYSLSTVLIANGVFGSTTRTWKAAGDDSWTLDLETVSQSYNGPVHEFQNFTFEKSGKQVQLKSVEASAGRPTDVTRNIDMLLEAPNGRHSTPVERCAGSGAAGYHYNPRK
ncbi:MAG: hypothetical protein ABI821_04035 [Pseudomonadota bacterium]